LPAGSSCDGGDGGGGGGGGGDGGGGGGSGGVSWLWRGWSLVAVLYCDCERDGVYLIWWWCACGGAWW